MANCSNCGSWVNGRYCKNCGEKVEGPTLTTGSSYSDSNDLDLKLPNLPATKSKRTPGASQYKLGWHKFLIYFGLWVIAIWQIYAGVTWFQAGTYDSTFYLFVISDIALGLFAIVVRFRLAVFKMNAPKSIVLFYVVLGLVIALQDLYLVSTFGFDAGEYAFYGVSNIPFGIICWRYYSSRQELFIN